MKCRYFFVFSLFVNFLISFEIPLEKHLQELETDGVTLIPNLFSESQVKEFAETFWNVKEKGMNIIENLPPTVRVFYENNKESRTVYWKTENEVILQAGSGRYDFYLGFMDGIFGSDQVLHNECFENLMKELMIGEFTNYSGIIYNTVGSEDQYWHRDTNNLSNRDTEGDKLVLLDDFYFTILIPITVPFTFENGTAEFLKGSHRKAASDFKTCESMRVEVPLGSAIVFNGKINHRGRANLSIEDRPALYLVYHKKWYNDRYRVGVM